MYSFEIVKTNTHLLFIVYNIIYIIGLGGGPGVRGRYKPQEEEFLDARREERERIGQIGVSSIWGKSPTRPE